MLASDADKLHQLIAQAWLQLFPDSKIAIKGGDRTLLLNYLQALYPEIADSLIVEPNLIFLGMCLY